MDKCANCQKTLSFREQTSHNMIPHVNGAVCYPCKLAYHEKTSDPAAINKSNERRIMAEQIEGELDQALAYLAACSYLENQEPEEIILEIESRE